MMNDLIGQILLMIFIPFAFVALIMPFIKRIAIRVGAVDNPGGRHIHKRVMPKLGGLGIFFGFLLGYMIFGEHSDQMNSILIGSFIIILTGVIDDINSLSPKDKLVGQLLSAGVIAFYGEILLSNISIKKLIIIIKFRTYLNFSLFFFLKSII